VNVTRRRLVIPIVLLAAFLSLAPAGLALPRAVIGNLFGQHMIRAEVLDLGPDGSVQDLRVDRGVILTLSPASLTISELDGTSVSIDLSPSTSVTGRIFALRQLRRGMRVTVIRPANGPASIVEVGAAGSSVFGQRTIRAEVLGLAADGSVQDVRIDRGTTRAVTPTSLTISELDGTSVTVDLSASTSVTGRIFSTAQLRRGMRVTVVRPANGAASIVQVGF
jgi:riboflavin synthase alpha subunit